MSSSSERLTRGRVLHGSDVAVGTADLGAVTSRAATGLLVSPELIAAAERDGYQTGYEQGYEAGYTEGIAHAREHASLLGGLVERLGRAADELLVRESATRHQVEDDVVATAFRIAEAIIGREIADPGTAARDAIARALACVPGDGIVIARMHPADIALVESNEFVASRNLQLVADASLMPGDCIVDVAACRVDASIESALERVREVLS